MYEIPALKSNWYFQFNNYDHTDMWLSISSFHKARNLSLKLGVKAHTFTVD